MKHHHQTKHFLIRRMGTASFLIALAPALAYSQTDEEPTERKTLAPLVVTSEEDTQAAIQDASASVDILTSQSLEDRDIRRIPDIFKTISNVDVNDITEIASVPTFTVRGTAEDINIDAFGGTPSVAYYMDDIPALSVYSRSLPIFNLDTASFYKGPHGTQFGAPGSAGVLRLASVLPGNDFNGDYGYTYGSYDRHQVDGSVSGPVIKDRLAIGFSGLFETREGYVHNAVLNDSYGDIEEMSGRMQLVYTPSADLEILFTLGLASQDNGGPNFTSNNGGDLYTVLQGIEGFQKYDSDVEALRITSKRDGYNIVSATSRQYNDGNILYDFGTFFGSNPFTLETVYGTYDVEEEAYTQEFRVESDDDSSPLQWTAGVFFGTRDNKTTGEFTYSNLGGFINGASTFPNNAEQDTYAIFGQASYTFWDKLEITGGLRAEMVESRRDSVLIDPLLFFGGNATNSGEKTTSGISPMAGLSWKWNDDHCTYFRFSTGFQPGDIASASHLVAGAPREYEEQTSLHFELGHKASFYDKRLTVNPVVYYTHYDDYQAFLDMGIPGLPLTAVFNAQSAYAMGAELQIVVEPIDGLRIASNLGVQEAEYNRFRSGAGNYDGKDIPNIPSFNARNSITYRHELDGGAALMGMMECNVTGDYKFDQNNTGGQDTYTLLNARIGYEWQHSGIYLFAANLLDEAYLPSGYAAFPAGTFRGTPGAPQTFGVEFRTNF
jgi:iron complex outermembrane receptor protein